MYCASKDECNGEKTVNILKIFSQFPRYDFDIDIIAGSTSFCADDFGYLGHHHLCCQRPRFPNPKMTHCQRCWWMPRLNHKFIVDGYDVLRLKKSDLDLICGLMCRRNTQEIKALNHGRVTWILLRIQYVGGESTWSQRCFCKNPGYNQYHWEISWIFLGFLLTMIILQDQLLFILATIILCSQRPRNLKTKMKRRQRHWWMPRLNHEFVFAWY